MSKKWLILGGLALAIVAGLTVYAGPGNITKKALFYTGAVGVLIAKIFGFLSAGLAWPMFIVLAVVGTITDASPTASNDTLTAQGTIAATSASQ